MLAFDWSPRPTIHGKPGARDGALASRLDAFVHCTITRLDQQSDYIHSLTSTH